MSAILGLALLVALSALARCARARRAAHERLPDTWRPVRRTIVETHHLDNGRSW